MTAPAVALWLRYGWKWATITYDGKVFNLRWRWYGK